MIKKDSRFRTPNRNVIIWRYMSFEKFLDIIINKRLFFSNAGEMTDKDEVAIPFENYAKMLQGLKDDPLRDMKAKFEIISKETKYKTKKISTYVNCWCKNKSESYAFWKIYLGGSKCGIAIKTNIRRLTDSVNNSIQEEEYDIFVGDIKYADYIPEPIDHAKLITTKSLYYKYENEVRLIIIDEQRLKGSPWDPQNHRKGIKVNCDPIVLIETIFISPFTNPAFQNVIRQTIGKIDKEYSNRIEISQIRDS